MYFYIRKSLKVNNHKLKKIITSNHEYRIKFIIQYFQYEKNSYQWIHLPEEDSQVQLFKNSYIEFEHDNKNEGVSY